jgi:hypothetical protein
MHNLVNTQFLTVPWKLCISCILFFIVLFVFSKNAIFFAFLAEKKYDCNLSFLFREECILIFAL